MICQLLYPCLMYQGIFHLLYPCLIFQGYSAVAASMPNLSAAVSLPDVLGVYFSCSIHAWCVRDILQLLYPCLMCQGYISAAVSMIFQGYA
jgi:hypothetical protein